MAVSTFSLKWTTKVPSSKIQDPLDVYALKFLEDYFLLGITTQTQRLRYFSFLTWAWKKIIDDRLDWRKILDMEKMITFTAAIHHLNDKEPKGIRNKKSAIEFLKGKSIVDVDKFTNFGRRNRDGYGNYYYRGSCQRFGLWRRYENEVIFSSLGRHIAQLFEKAISNNDSLFLRKKVNKKELSKLFDCCFCNKKIPRREKRAWRKIFFGFVKFTPEGDIRFDKETFERFINKKLKTVPDIEIGVEAVQGNYLQEDLESTMAETFDETIHEKVKRSIARRYTLFLIMKVIDEANPKLTPSWNINQVIRDAIYYKQVERNDGKTKEVNFQTLEKIRSIWEVYVHGLYYISFLEFMFEILLNMLQRRPSGTTISNLVSSLNWQSIIEELQKHGTNTKDENVQVAEFESAVHSILNHEKTSLKSKLNEKKLLLALLGYGNNEEALAALLILIVLLKYRYETFSKSQLQLTRQAETRLGQVNPSKTYTLLAKNNLATFIKNTFELIKNRHRLVSSLKYVRDGTKSWLLTEEEGSVFHYGKDLWEARGYREAKWNNVVELLMDMDLLNKEGNILTLTREGKEWLARIL